MTRQFTELESLLQLLVDEHRRLLAHAERHQAVMKAFDLKAMDVVTNLQDASRLRIATIENKRKTLVAIIAKAHRLQGPLTLTKLADLHPPRRAALLTLRDELRTLAAQIATRTHVAGKLAGTVLGHLNTVVRLLAGAVEKAGLYTKHGVPRVSSRIGMMEAVG